MVEAVLYIAIVSMVLVAVSTLGWTVVNNGAKSRSQEEVIGTARFLSERIGYEIRRASGITTVGTSSISLTNYAPDTTTVISLDASSGKVRINKNGTGDVDLNSNDTRVQTLTFVDYRSVDNKTKNIGFTITVNTAYSGGSQLFKATTTIRSSAEVRAN